MRAFDLLVEGRAGHRTAAQPRYHFEMALLRWMHLRKLVPLTELLERCERRCERAPTGATRRSRPQPPGAPRAVHPPRPRSHRAASRPPPCRAATAPPGRRHREPIGPSAQPAIAAAPTAQPAS